MSEKYRIKIKRYDPWLLLLIFGSALIFASLAMVVPSTLSAQPPDKPWKQVDLGSSTIDIQPLRYQGRDVIIRARTTAHPGIVVFRIVEIGSWGERMLGREVWIAERDTPANGTFVIQVINQPNRWAILRLVVSTESNDAMALIPGLDGVLGFSEATGCGAPVPDMSGIIIRQRLKELESSVPKSLDNWKQLLLSVDTDDLSVLLEGTVRVARCRSPVPAPSDPGAVPAPEVKAWILDIVLGDTASFELRLLRPLVENIPAPALKWAWLEARAIVHKAEN